MSEATPSDATRKPSNASTRNAGARPRLSFGAYHHDDLVSRAEAAQLLHVSRRTLEAWATEGYGPPYARMGRGTNAPAVYRIGDLLAFVASTMRRSTTES